MDTVQRLEVLEGRKICCANTGKNCRRKRTHESNSKGMRWWWWWCRVDVELMLLGFKFINIHVCITFSSEEAARLESQIVVFYR